MRTLSFSRSALLIGLLLCPLVGCQALEDRPDEIVCPDPRLTPATRETALDPPLPKVVEVKVPVVAPQLRPLPTETTPRPAPLTGLNAIAGAKAAATTQPVSEDFLNAIQYYDYAPGVVYTAITSPGFVTTIALSPGEKLLTAAAGDTTRWVVQSVAAGSGESQQTLLLVKPRKPFLQTNLVITTDQRVYELDLTSTDQPTYHTMIAWHYPYGDIVTIRNQVAQAAAREETAVSGSLNLNKMHFDYLILKQKDHGRPAWCPLRAFDDGQKTYIQFPPKVTVTEAPPLFVLNPKGDAQIVNYRVKGDYCIVDRLFDKAELRLGENPQTVVAIQRAQTKDE